MTYERFEDLPVWNQAEELGSKMFDWTGHAVFRGRGDLADQLQRAALSISNNIADGFERGSTNELLQFIYYARGSAGEVRSALCVMKRAEVFRPLVEEIDRHTSQCVSISRQLRGWANSLQNSDISGQRKLNDSTRRSYEMRRRQQEVVRQGNVFQEQLRARLEAEARERQSREDA